MGSLQAISETEDKRVSTLVEAVEAIDKALIHRVEAYNKLSRTVRELSIDVKNQRHNTQSLELNLENFDQLAETLDLYVGEIGRRVKRLEEHTERVEDLAQYDSRLEHLEQTTGRLTRQVNTSHQKLDDHGVALFLLIDRAGLMNELVGALRRNNS